MRRTIASVGLCAMTAFLVSGCVYRKLVDRPTPPAGTKAVPQAVASPVAKPTVPQDLSTDGSDGSDGSSSVVVTDGRNGDNGSLSIVYSDGRLTINGKTIKDNGNGNMGSGNGSNNGNGSHGFVRRSGSNAGDAYVVTQNIAATRVRTLVARTDYGEIVIEPANDSAHIGVTATVTLGDNDLSKSAREKYLRGFTIPDTVDGDVYTAGVTPPAALPEDISWVVSYRIVVPPSVALDLKTENGAVSVRDTHTRGKVLVRSSYGAISVSNAGSMVDAETNNGAIEIAGSAKRDSVVARTDYGAISLTGPVKSIDAQTENGAIAIRGAANAETVTAKSSYGAIDLVDVGGAVDAQTENGAVDYSGIPTTLALKSEYGRIAAELADCAKLTGAKLITENGSLTVTLPASASMSLTGHTSSGSIDVNGFAATITGDGYDKSFTATRNGGRAAIDLSTEYGSLTVTAR